jgi:DeoR/GlpR family transcriptional regulator of sugar metabolism
MTGGNLNKDDLSFYGRVAEEVATRFYTNKAILGASGISLEYGITAPSEEKAELKKTMLEHCHELIIVADHSKIDRITLFSVCDLERVGTLVTDSNAPESFQRSIRERGINLIVAD